MKFPFAALVVVTALISPPVLAETAVPQTEAQMSFSFAPVVKAAAPAVVNIYATRMVRQSRSPFAGDPFLISFSKDWGRARHGQKTHLVPG